jgi:hypothetical protein
VLKNIDGEEIWYLEGKLHRETGPAYIHKYFKKAKYYLYGEQVSEADFPKKLKLLVFW